MGNKENDLGSTGKEARGWGTTGCRRRQAVLLCIPGKPMSSAPLQRWLQLSNVIQGQQGGPENNEPLKRALLAPVSQQMAGGCSREKASCL